MTRISIVTPTLNVADFVDQTLRSVTNQDGVDLEYFVVDGGSTDGTIEKVNCYRERLAGILRQQGRGQYQAIIEGFSRSSGDIMAWLNADDIYLPWTLKTVERIFHLFPHVEWIIGLPTFINARGECTRISNDAASYPSSMIRRGLYRSHLCGYLQQESMFWRRSLWEKAGGLDPRYSLAADFKLWIDFSRHADLASVSVPLAAFRVRPDSQRSSVEREKYESEVQAICSRMRGPNPVWDLLAARSLVMRSLFRLLIWRKAPLISQSRTAGDWVWRESIRSISRTSLNGLLLEYGAR